MAKRKAGNKAPEKGDSSAIESNIDSQTGEGTGEARKVTLKGAKRYSENPFADVLTMRTRKKSEVVQAGRFGLQDLETGQMHDVVETRRVQLVDADKFVKVFAGQLSIFFSLSKPSMKMLEPMLDAISDHRVAHTDHVFFIYPDVVTYYDRLGQQPPSETSFYRALNEMVDKEFIAPSSRGRGWYFFNPAIFFNGDRVRFVTEIRKRKSKAEKLEEAGQKRLGFEGQEDAQ